MKEKIKDAAYQIFCTWIGWVGIVGLHVFVFMSMAPGGIFEVKNGSWPLYIGVPCTVLLFLFACVMFFYGIRNTIINWRVSYLERREKRLRKEISALKNEIGGYQPIDKVDTLNPPKGNSEKGGES